MRLRPVLVVLGLGLLAAVLFVIVSAAPVAPPTGPAPAAADVGVTEPDAAELDAAEREVWDAEVIPPSAPAAKSVVSVTLVTPALGPVGQWVYVHGDGFVPGATKVKMGEARPVDAAVYDRGQLGFTVPKGLKGPQGVTIIVPGGLASTAPDAYTVDIPHTAPHVTGVSPPVGPAGTWVYVSGAGFVFGATAMHFGERTLKGEVYSPDSLAFSVPNATPGRYPIAVTTVNGKGTLDGTFEVTAKP